MVSKYTSLLAIALALFLNNSLAAQASPADNPSAEVDAAAAAAADVASVTSLPDQISASIPPEIAEITDDGDHPVFDVFVGGDSDSTVTASATEDNGDDGVEHALASIDIIADSNKNKIIDGDIIEEALEEVLKKLGPAIGEAASGVVAEPLQTKLGTIQIGPTLSHTPSGPSDISHPTGFPFEADEGENPFDFTTLGDDEFTTIISHETFSTILGLPENWESAVDSGEHIPFVDEIMAIWVNDFSLRVNKGFKQPVDAFFNKCLREYTAKYYPDGTRSPPQNVIDKCVKYYAKYKFNHHFASDLRNGPPAIATSTVTVTDDGSNSVDDIVEGVEVHIGGLGHTPKVINIHL
ncbi:hypothetical protein H4219_003937 [Mycoemilia scoparia]|uniref:Uncharacterized protein n=1 Tax=Mycoemilia scoparia TaxID=417184 RepID=A0A9W7ZTA3_9FUNG|nr:hypothetical protein H4219_003937 [Mycoemilia scoparia]